MRIKKLTKLHPLLTNTQLFFSSISEKNSLFPIETYDVGQRLDRYLKSTNIGWQSAQKHLRNKNIRVVTQNGTIIAGQNKYRFQPGDQLAIRKGLDLQQLLIGSKNTKHIQMDHNLARETLDSMVVFDNENITVVNKAAGFSVQGGPVPSMNLFSLMAARFKKQKVYISHRLDKPTSGLVLLPKNLKTAQHLGRALESREGIEKFYIALTEGNRISRGKGVISCHLEWTNKHKARISEQIAGNDRSQLAQTSYHLIQSTKLSDILWRNLMGLKLLTGRKHQIRCQLSSYLLNPIINDGLYLGRRDKLAGEHIFLHAFGMKIKSRPILEEVFKIYSKKGVIADSSSGNIQVTSDGIQILATPSQIWRNTIPEPPLPFLRQLLTKIDEIDPRSRQTSKIA